MSNLPVKKEAQPIEYTNPFAEILTKEGIELELLAKKLKEELDATEEKAFNDKERGVVYSKPLIAWDIRQRARMDAQNIFDVYPEEKHRITADMIVHRSPEELELLRSVAREVAERMKKEIE